jgi:hypothetical protein
MSQRCPECGTDNPEDVPACLGCGAPLALPGRAADGVEIEVYDLATPAPPPSAFEKALAATRAGAGPAGEGAAASDDDGFLRQEIEDGYKIRARRKSYRTHTGRNILITAGALAVVAVGVLIVVRLTMAKLPKYDYARPASAAGTEAALGLAAEAEATLRLPVVPAGAAFGTLGVVGEPGKVFVDGDYVGDAPLQELRLPLGTHHVLVKRRAAVLLDEHIDVRAGERYTLSPAATAIYSHLDGSGGPGK